MKLVHVQKLSPDASRFVFHLSKRDHNLLLSVLKLFPCTDPKAHRLSHHATPENKANQELLVEAMEEQQRLLIEWLKDVTRPNHAYLHEHGEAMELVINDSRIEWLLRVLNDVRVGSWMRLGCPKMEDVRRAVLNQESAAHYTAMELSGYFQSVLLEAIREGAA